MSFIEKFKAILPKEINFEEIYELVPANLWKTNPRKAGLLALERIGIFNKNIYLQRYKDVQESGIDALYHYILHGIEENRILTVNNNIKISIIIPVYNNASYLCECIESAIQQTLMDIEIIILNDGSTDSTVKKIINLYKNKDKRIIFIDKNNSGYGDTVNIGIKKSHGEYIGIIESDDYVEKSMYEIMYNNAKKFDADIIKCNPSEFIDTEKERKFKRYKISANKNDYYRYIDFNYDFFAIRTSTLNPIGIFKRSFLMSNKILFSDTPGASFQDIGFNILTYSLAKKIIFVDEYLYNIRRDNANSSVFSTKKINSAPYEFKNAFNILIQKNVNFIPLFFLRKLNSYKFHYNRLDKDGKKFFKDICFAEFLHHLENNEINLESLSESDKNFIGKFINLNQINTAIEISFIIPIYNAEKYIEECINSILSQNLKNIEIICVDDGSTDRSSSIIKKLKSNDQRIIYICQENYGAGKARNIGLAFANGKYVMFIDADDFYEKYSLSYLLKECKSKNADIAIFRSQKYYESTNAYEEMKYAFTKHNIPSKSLFNWTDMKDSIFNSFGTYPWNKIFKRQFLLNNNIKFQEIKRTNDLFFVFKALINAKRLIAVDKICINYRKEVLNSLQSTNDNSYLDFWKASYSFFIYLNKIGKYDLLKNSFINCVIDGAYYNYNTLRNKELKINLLKIIKFVIIPILQIEDIEILRNDILKEFLIKILNNDIAEIKFNKKI